MVQEYSNRYYLPCSARYQTLCSSDFSGAKELAAWRQKLMTSWHQVSVTGITSRDGLEMSVGKGIDAVARVRLGSLSPEDVTVEAYYGRLNPNGDFLERETVTLEAVDSADGEFTYRGTIPCARTGRYGFTVRITPSHKRLENRFVMGLVTWA
jgi:starch phosphorylase